METKKKIGYYGGKFFPMHKGHLFCIQKMAEMSDKGNIIIFINGPDERNYLKNHPFDSYLSVESRIAQVEKVCKMFPNLRYHVIDCTNLRNPDGTEDWDAETPLVRAVLPHIDYVFSSEPSYDTYFKEAFPEAKHVVVDSDRKAMPISATKIREMSKEEREKWMV